MSFPVSNTTAYLNEFRDFKLRLISSDVEFNINKESVKKYKNELFFIKSNFPNDIITGSLALNLLGLIDREISDIDILIDDVNRYSNYNLSSYKEDTIVNRLGFIYFNYKRNFFTRRRYYTVDFFKNVNVDYIEFEFQGTTLKVQHPLMIMSLKREMNNRHKHCRDLEIIFQKFDSF